VAAVSLSFVSVTATLSMVCTHAPGPARLYPASEMLSTTRDSVQERMSTEDLQSNANVRT